MNLPENVRRMLNALSFAHAGENLSRTQKDRVLAQDQPAAVREAEFVPPAATAERSQIGLYLGCELPADILQYVVRTCARMRYGLTVLTFQSQAVAEELLAAHADLLKEAGITPTIVPLSGEPLRALPQALRRRSDIAFLVCNESGYLSRGLLNGTQSALPVPVVLVSGDGAPATRTAPEALDTRAA